MVHKMLSFFFSKLQLITVLLLICHSYMSWSTRFISLNLCVGFSISDSISFLLKYIFLFHKTHGLFDFKTLKFLLKLKNSSETSDFYIAIRSFKIQWYLHELELCKHSLDDKFLKLRTLKFWEHYFFSIVMFT